MRPPLRILHVEDSQAYARLVALVLDDELGGTVTITHVGTLEACLAHLAASGADCVLLDLSLPDEHGPDGVDRVRAAQPGVPVVVLSGRAVPGLEADLAARGASLVLKGEELGLAEAVTRAVAAG